ncbi:MAG: M48 family metallopeptidase, partial [Bacteroidota bacterium]|nr:M48 family metallopeptidase [Bacteroidota bacterium]
MPFRSFGGGRRGGGRIIIAVLIAIGSLISYYSVTQENPVTGEKQHIGIAPEQEIALGLEAMPTMMQQYGGESDDMDARAIVQRVGQKIVESSPAGKSDYKSNFVFHLLADNQTVNAFALPGGQIFITEALYRQLTSEDELAGVLGHEIGHVIARHSAEQMAKARLTQGLTGAAVIATYDPGNPATTQTAAFAQLIGQMVNMRYGREDELEADKWGVKLMGEAGYDPYALIEVMNILEKA